MQLHFISDLHLDENKPGITRILLNYLQGQARQADVVYLLGDIFEYWLGDDISQPRYENICKALLQLHQFGVKTCFMRGNRDFLVSDAFADSTGCEILDDPVAIKIGNRKALLSHGDLFCTDDVEHQKFRKLVSQPEVRNRLLSLPADQREQMAQQLRGMSKSGNSLKAADIMDVTQSTVEKVMTQHDADLLIHGHTHRQAVHEFQLGGQSAQRVVLSDWHENEGSVLVCKDEEFEFQTLG